MANHTSSKSGCSDPKRKESADDCGQIDSIIGSYGRYQFMIFMFKILIGASSAFNNLGVSFYAPTNFVSFWCADLDHQPQLNASQSLSSAASNWTLAGPSDATSVVGRPLGLSEPSWSIGSLMSDAFYNAERGRRHSDPNWSSDTPRGIRQECSYLSPRDNQSRECTSFKYDTGIWMSTIIDEWDLVCDRSLYISITQSLYMAGFIVAYIMFGYLSDHFGRWRSLLLGATLEILGGLGCALSTSVAQFVCFRFIVGVGNAGRSTSSYLIMIEWTGSAWRMQISTLGSLGWAVSYCAMPWIAMYFLHFRHLQIFVCLYEFCFVTWLLFLPESPRWLLTHKRFDEAREVLLGAAKFNGLITSERPELDRSSFQTKPTKCAFGRLEAPPLDLYGRKRLNSIGTPGASNPNTEHNQLDEQQATSIGQPTPTHEVAPMRVPLHTDENHLSELANSSAKLEPYTMDEFEAKFAKLVGAIQRKEFTKSENENKLSFVDLVRWRNLRSYTLILAFIWGVNSFIYYGIALRVGTLNGTNLFVSFALAGATEFPGLFFTLMLMKFLPRRLSNILLFSTILALCLIKVPLHYYELAWLEETSMMLAKLINSCSFTCILYQTMELFPTSIRQTAYSSCALAGRIGSILAPFVKELAQLTNEYVPPVVYAVLSLLEILLVRRLPETRGSDMPDTLLEAEKFKGTSGKPARASSSSPSSR